MTKHRQALTKGWNPKGKKALDDALKALEMFRSTIEATGGVVLNSHGHYEPVGDQDWIDLGESYVRACEALGREPMVEKDQEEGK